MGNLPECGVPIVVFSSRKRARHTPENMKTHRVDGHTSRLSSKAAGSPGQAGRIAWRRPRALRKRRQNHCQRYRCRKRTRELVYYYFHGKKEITRAVLDDYIDDLVESAMVWNENREFGKTRQSLRACVQAFRRSLYDAAATNAPWFAL